VDLSKWVSEEYCVPGREAVPEAGPDDRVRHDTENKD
jgi:hypothetical protein